MMAPDRDTTVSSLASLSPLPALLARTHAFAEQTWLRQAPSQRFVTPNRVLHETAAIRLREFTRAGGSETSRDTARDADAPPLLIVPPEVNRSTIVDFAPGQSLVGAALEAGFARVGVIQWRTATARTARRDIDDSVADILEAASRLGGDRGVHLLGVCQGGWESAVAAALRPERTVSLTLVAAPIDFQAGEGVLKHLTRVMPMAAYRSLVLAGQGRMPGSLISLGFDALQPFERFFLKPLSIYNHLNDPQWLRRYHQLNDWYRAPKDLPGPMYLRAVRELFKENRLVQGRFTCLGERVRLERITCSLCLVAGARDHITPPPQLLEARRFFGSSHVREVLTDGGHIGTFMGRRELRSHWPGIFAWLHREAGETQAPGTAEEAGNA